jgi:hypothetical protein
MSPLDDFNFDEAMVDTGHRSNNKRRLSDKILAAFNHAYAVGEDEIANQLRDALAANESEGASRPRRYERIGYDPIGEADLWINFVKARNGYRTACETDKSDAAASVISLETMKDAYRRWSMG